ncbi:MAG TPA: tetratricopeptide repeat protein [Terriglobales bacterium]|nr:tetratricopeptide repeat protein [Terriglobales bacterium]
MRNKVRNQLLCGGLLVLLSLLPLAQISPPTSTMSLLQHAAQAMTAGKYPLAERDLQAVLQAAPDDYRALDLLGVVRVLQHRDLEAEKLFRHAVQKKADFAPSHAHLGLLYFQKGRTNDAVPELREALRINAARTDASSALVQILREQSKQASAAGDSAGSLTLLREARDYAPDNPDVQFEFGSTALQLSLWGDAIAAFQQTLKLRQNDPVALYSLGRAFLGEWKFEEARQQFARYIEERPDDASGHCALGMTLAALENTQEAREQFKRSISLAPEQVESYFRLGLIDLNMKDLDDAATNFRHVLDRDAKHAAALSGLGRVAFEQRQYSDAIDLLQRAIATDDSLREAHYYLGLALARVGRREESDSQLQISTRLEHDEAQQRRTVLRVQDGRAGDDQN